MLVGLAPGVPEQAQFARRLAENSCRVLVPTLIALRSHGVTPDYVRELQQLGYRGLTAGMLIELRSHGVSAEYARQMREAGFRDLTPEELIGLRSQGVQPDLLQRLRARWRPREEKP